MQVELYYWVACLSVCLLVTFESLAKTAEAIKMLFGGWFRTTYYMGSRFPTEGQLWGLCGPLKSISSRCLSCQARICGQILTICTSYDVFLRKEVSFGGRVNTTPHIRDEIIQKPHFGSVNRHFKANTLYGCYKHAYKNPRWRMAVI